MKAIIAGPDRGLREAFEAQGVEITAIDGVITNDVLAGAGIEDAELIVLTDVGEASAVPVAKKANPEVKVVFYDEKTMPDFVRGQVDIAVDPKLMDPETIAEELSGQH